MTQQIPFSPANRGFMVELDWDIATAYDLFVSLSVLHSPEKVGLRPSWAAGVRSRLPATERDFLSRVAPIIFPYRWIHNLPWPKDSRTVIDTLAAIPAAERLAAIDAPGDLSPDVESLFRGVAARGSWDAGDYQRLQGYATGLGWQGVSPSEFKSILEANLDLWADVKGTGECLLSSLEAYHDQFFAEEELRIAPYLQPALAHAQELAPRLTLMELLEVTSQGVRLDEQMRKGRLVLAPSFWITPRLLFAHLEPGYDLYLYGARPAGVSLIPGDDVPDALFQALKAMADPTRLRILRYLSDEPQTPAQLARRLRLRPPTVIHHLDALRLARLVHITLSEDGKQYAARPGAVDATFELLNDFLSGEPAEEGDAPDGAGGDTADG